MTASEKQMKENKYTSTSSVQEQPRLCILHNPGQALVEVLARHCAALQQVPPMGPDLVKLQCLRGLGEKQSSVSAIETLP